MASFSDLKQYVVSINKGIIQTIDKWDLTSELSEGSKTDFSPNIFALMRKEWSWANGQYDLQIEMLGEVFVRVFITRAKALFEGYIPSTKEGHQSHLEGYIHFVLMRAFQEVSKLKYNDMKKYKELNPMEGQSIDDALDNAMITTKLKTSLEVQNKIEELDELIDWLEQRIETVKHTGIEGDNRRLAVLHKKLDNLVNEKELLIKESTFDHNRKYSTEEIEHDMNDFDKVHFDQLIKDLKSVIKVSTSNPDPQIKLFDLLVEGYSPTEISKIMEVSTAKISQRITQLKTSLVKLAEQYKEDGDEDLLNFLGKMTGKRTPTVSKVDPTVSSIASIK